MKSKKYKPDEKAYIKLKEKRKGKTYEEIYGEEKAKEIKHKIKIANTINASE